MSQSNLFERERPEATDAAPVVLYAFGEFQERGKVLAERDLPLDRLRGALRRAAEAFGVEELDDEQATGAMSALGARIRRVPSFFAKHPYRVIVPTALAARAREFYRQQQSAGEAAEG